MTKITRLLLTCIVVMGLVIAGCSNSNSDNKPINQDENKTPTKEDVAVPSPEKVEDAKVEDATVEEIDKTEEAMDKATNALVEEEILMRDFFLPNNTKAHYKGDGNEFAELDIEVIQPYDNYIIVYENNGGAYMQKL